MSTTTTEKEQFKEQLGTLLGGTDNEAIWTEVRRLFALHPACQPRINAHIQARHQLPNLFALRSAPVTAERDGTFKLVLTALGRHHLLGEVKGSNGAYWWQKPDGTALLLGELPQGQATATPEQAKVEPVKAREVKPPVVVDVPAKREVAPATDSGNEGEQIAKLLEKLASRGKAAVDVHGEVAKAMNNGAFPVDRVTKLIDAATAPLAARVEALEKRFNALMKAVEVQPKTIEEQVRKAFVAILSEIGE